MLTVQFPRYFTSNEPEDDGSGISPKKTEEKLGEMFDGLLSGMFGCVVIRYLGDW